MDNQLELHERLLDLAEELESSRANRPGETPIFWGIVAERVAVRQQLDRLARREREDNVF